MADLSDDVVLEFKAEAERARDYRAAEVCEIALEGCVPNSLDLPFTPSEVKAVAAIYATAANRQVQRWVNAAKAMGDS